MSALPRHRRDLPSRQGLYDPRFEHDSCGVGFVAQIKGQRSHQILIDAEEVLRNMDHRGACGCEPNTGDGAGILTALPHEFLRKVVKQDLGTDLPEPGQFAAGLVFLPTDKAQRAKCKQVVEELIGAHGGLGGPQTKPFLLHPAEWEPDLAPLIGAPAVYDQLRRWMEDELGMTFGPRADEGDGA